MGDKNQQEYFRKIQELELELDQIKIQEEQEYKQLLEKIEQIKFNLSKFSDLLVYDFLKFFRLDHNDYATFYLLYYIYPECEDIKYYVRSLLMKIINKDLTNYKNQADYLSIIDNLPKESLPSIEQIVDEVNIKINHDPIGICSKKLINPVNDHLILKILYLYTKDFAYEKSNLGYLVKKILQANNISFELPDVYRL